MDAADARRLTGLYDTAHERARLGDRRWNEASGRAVRDFPPRRHDRNYIFGHMAPNTPPVTRPNTKPSKVCLSTVLNGRLYQMTPCHNASV